MDVYITRTASFLPNQAIDNNNIEHILGMVNKTSSRVKKIILKRNGINHRYYAIDPLTREQSHTNAELTACAIRQLFTNESEMNDVELLTCGTTLSDEIVLGHAECVKQVLKIKALPVTIRGICVSGVSAMKYGYLSIKTGEANNAVCSGSEVSSAGLRSERFTKAHEKFKSDETDIETMPEISFGKEFLRWMLSDGAGSVYLEPTLPDRPSQSVAKIEWMKIYSYANEQPACMYAAAIKNEDGSLTGWLDDAYPLEGGLFIEQDVKQLNENITHYAQKAFVRVREEMGVSSNDFDYFLPHLSSNYFFQKLKDDLEEIDYCIDDKKWYTNLSEKGNTGSASIYIMLDELLKSGRCKKGERILCFIPESSRFSYSFIYLTIQ